MNNQVILIGRITVLPEEDSGDFHSLTISVQSNFKNRERKYEYEEIKVKVYQGTAEMVTAQAKEGDYVALRGRLVTQEESIGVIGECLTILKI